jgi:hypothetical protein
MVRQEGLYQPNSPITFYFLPVEVQSTLELSVQASRAKAVQSKGAASY